MGFEHFCEEYPNAAQRIIVYCEEKTQSTEDGIDTLPWRVFCQKLWDKNYFS